MPDLQRFLGLAFATSDLLLEVDEAGVIVFAMGSGAGPETPPESLIGSRLTQAMDEPSAVSLDQALARLQPGMRSPPVDVRLRTGQDGVRGAELRLFLLPGLAPNISCAVRYEGGSRKARIVQAAPVMTPVAFLDQARRFLLDEPPGRELVVAFVDVEGLGEAASLEPGGDRLVAAVEATLQAASVEGSCAGRLGSDRFALLKDRASANNLISKVRELGAQAGVALDVRSAEVDMPPACDPLQALRALRFAVEACLADGGLEHPELSFTAALARTLREAEAFRNLVKFGDFELHYQPIVDLRTQTVHHFEALTRFRSGPGPAETIRMAEELALIGAFDLVVVEKALIRLRQRGSGLMRFAVNLSGASLGDDQYIQALLRMTAATPADRRRLIVEVTESAALADMEAANRRLGALRAAGIRVCIDDFGAGAASYDYLRALRVDTVKIDGRFIQNIENVPRLQTMVGHLSGLCRSLGVETIAEMVETKAAAAVLADLGVNYGQGWHFGKAEPDPRTVLPPSETVRRTGFTEAWG